MKKHVCRLCVSETRPSCVSLNTVVLILLVKSHNFVHQQQQQQQQKNHQAMRGDVWLSECRQRSHRVQPHIMSKQSERHHFVRPPPPVVSQSHDGYISVSPPKHTHPLTHTHTHTSTRAHAHAHSVTVTRRDYNSWNFHSRYL